MMNDLAYTIIRRPRRRTVSISVSPKNEITVAVPKHLSDEDIRDIVERKAAWIRGKIKFNLEARQAHKPREYVSGEMFSYLGRDYLLEVVDSEAAPVRFADGRLCVQVPPQVRPQDRDGYIVSELTAWYQSRGLETLRERVMIYARRLDTKPVRVTIKDMRTQWGSCTSKGNISLNWRIVLAPISIVDYVVAHELCHLVHHNHSKEFWTLLQSVFPDYKERKEWLRVNGGLLTLR